jgi:hypothetical protein
MDLYEKIREIICKESVNPLLQKFASFHREGGWAGKQMLYYALPCTKKCDEKAV